MEKSFILFIFLVMVACSKSGNEKVPPPQVNEKAEVGPFKVKFENSNYTHTFYLPIAQSEGSVDYLITLPEANTIELSNTEVKVIGCPSEQITHKIFWRPDSNQNRGFYLEIGSKFYLQAKLQGKLIHLLYGLQGCTDIQIMTSLTKK